MIAVGGRRCSVAVSSFWDAMANCPQFLPRMLNAMLALSGGCGDNERELTDEQAAVRGGKEKGEGGREGQNDRREGWNTATTSAFSCYRLMH